MGSYVYILKVFFKILFFDIFLYNIKLDKYIIEYVYILWRISKYLFNVCSYIYGLCLNLFYLNNII